ncbi:mediator complex, subunit Med4 [Neohortaea acidophila]|uniref:Mediator of RNA polymerase II transcription subunit 4 n=1 Tax=Neohortaea acidophila TaxID=245834 RepID=A0A6A6Q5C3_9PEZI|nr:mediator complex, subunit Med4 [Neohortaea acidophila]KAF2487174.1 mediator complex, subunit Med4 [Neohortaea acidophila]
MLSQFQQSYQRVEQSLQRLTDSIAAYNPSVSAAEELVAADEEVNANLEQLVTHQRNYARIQQLRQTTESLDETLRQTLTILADARNGLLAIPAHDEAGDDRREIKVDELLAYAKFISPTTVPPTFRKKAGQPSAPAIKREGGGQDAHMTNGLATPSPGAQELAAKTEMENVMAAAGLDEKSDPFVDPRRDLPFEPWPSHAIIQRGALGDIQRMIDGGLDPGAVLTAEEQAEADQRRKEVEEREALAQEEAERRRMRMFDTAAAKGQPAVSDVFNPDDL